MTQDERAQLRTEIERFGFVDPITCRNHPTQVNKWQIIDGENRWEVGVEMGMPAFPCYVIDVDDDEARMLTPILNELHGTADSQKLSELLKDLAQRRSEQELRELMPYSRDRFDELIGEISVDWNALEQKRQAAQQTTEERWVERVYRMPADAAAVVDQAVEKARSDAEVADDWKGLEFVCAEYLGG